jgi:YgiT-type zinc finger domain-containing protein
MTGTGPEPEPTTTYACSHCQAGTLRLRRVVFAHWFGGQFVTIPNFPGWVCDVCGEREYDAVALEQVQLILGPQTDSPTDSSRRTLRGMPNFNSQSRPSGRRPI